MADGSRSLEELLEAMVDALDDEIAAVRARGESRSLRFRAGRKKSARPGVHTYEVRLERGESHVDAVTATVIAAGTTQGAELLDVDDRTLTFAVSRDIGESVASGVIEIDPSAVLEATQRALLDVLDSADEDLLDRQSIGRILGLDAAPDPEPDEPAATDDLARSGLDEFQQAAVHAALRQPLAFVWGPPGTGKTLTLGHLAAALVADGRRVLLVAHSHAAVDTAVLATLAAGAAQERVLRLGTPQLAEVPDRIVVKSPPSDDEGPRVLAATLSKVATSGVGDGAAFDAVVLDEASMAQLPQVVLAVGLAPRTTVFGDVRQLPPIVSARSDAAHRWLGRDVFQAAGVADAVLSGREDPRLHLLARQYRAVPEIAEVTNRFAYDGRLTSDPSTHERTRLRDAPPAPGAAAVLWDTSGLGPVSMRPQSSRCNPVSALLVASAAADAAASVGALSAGERLVGVAAPYVEQVRLIRALLEPTGWADTIEVSTVHRFQGGERECMFVDLCDARPWRPPPFLTGDEGLRLLNVAMSRARSKLVVVADTGWLRAGPPGRAVAVVADAGLEVDAAAWEGVDWLATPEFIERGAQDVASARTRVLVRAPRLRPSPVVDALAGVAKVCDAVTVVTDEGAQESALDVLREAGADVSVEARVLERLVIADDVVYVGNTMSRAARTGRAMVRSDVAGFARRLATTLTPRPPREDPAPKRRAR